MIWSFVRSGERLSCEIRRDPLGLYEFVVTHPDGSERTERFEEPADVVARSVDVMRGLVEDGWRSARQDEPAVG